MPVEEQNTVGLARYAVLYVVIKKVYAYNAWFEIEKKTIKRKFQPQWEVNYILCHEGENVRCLLW